MGGGCTPKKPIEPEMEERMNEISKNKKLHQKNPLKTPQNYIHF